MRILAFAALIILTAGFKTTYDLYDNCTTSNVFNMHSFDLLYFPPGPTKYSMTRALGNFNENFYVPEVFVAYTDSVNTEYFPSPINYTYIPEQEVQFAPWFSLSGAESGSYSGVFGIMDIDENPVYCWHFNFTLP